MSEQEPEGNGRLLRYRVDDQGKRLDRVEEWRTKVDEDRTAMKSGLTQLHKDLADLSAQVRGNNRIMIGLLVTIAGSTFVGALTVLLATGQL